MGKASRLAAGQGLGRPVRTYRQVFPLWFPMLFVAMVVVIAGATAVNPNLGIGVKLAGAAVPLLALGISLLLGLISGLLPARNAGRLAITDALGRV